MSNKAIVILVVLGIFGLLGVSCAGTVLGYRSDCVNAEAGIEAQWEANKSSYDNMWKEFREMAQVPKMYADQLKDLWKDVISGRYGKEGSKQLFLAIKEENPKLDPSMYTKIQSAIEAGRTRFNQDQKELLDKKAQYERILKGNTSLIAGIFVHYPKIDLNKYAIVTSDVTEKAFEEKKADEIKLQ